MKVLLLISTLICLTTFIQFTKCSYHEDILKLHNEERKRLNIPPLQLDDHLNEVAQEWAEQMAQTGDFKHSRRPGLGENIAVRWPSAQDSPSKLYNQWLNEKENYRYGKYPQPSKNGQETGHYSQIVWADSTKLGVGYATNSKTKKAYLVTNYYPPGNVLGKYPYEKKN